MFLINISHDKENNQINLNFDGEFSEKHKKLFSNFTESYEIEYLLLDTPLLNYNSLKDKQERTCRFCKKSYPEVTFRNKAHIIPQLIGNKKFITDEECDNCNHKLSRYENDLANFIGMTRTLSMSIGQEGVPKFKTADKKLVIQKGNARKNFIEIISESKEFDHVKIDKVNKKITIEAIKGSYKPINVYKSLLKVALSLIPKEELNKYEQSIKFLNISTSDDKFKGNPFLRLFGYFIPGIPFIKPMAFLWKKKESAKNKLIPNRVLVIYFQTYIYQIFITHDENDKELYNGKKVEFKIPPPFLHKIWIEKFGEPGFFNIDLSDSEIKKGEPQKITMKCKSINLDENLIN